MDQEHVEERFKEHLMNAAQEMMMRQFEATAAEPEAFVLPFALVAKKGEDGLRLTLVEMAGLTTWQQRCYLLGLLEDMGAAVAAMAVVNEEWCMQMSADASPEDQELLQRLRESGRLQDAPDHLRSERLAVYYESPSERLAARAWTIVREDGLRKLVPETDVELHFPRKEFRRYFLEDGKRFEPRFVLLLEKLRAMLVAPGAESARGVGFATGVLGQVLAASKDVLECATALSLLNAITPGSEEWGGDFEELKNSVVQRIDVVLARYGAQPAQDAPWTRRLARIIQEALELYDG